MNTTETPETDAPVSENVRRAASELVEADEAFRAAQRALDAASIARRDAVAAAAAAGFAQAAIGEVLGIKRQSVADLIRAANAPAQPSLLSHGERAARPLRPVRGRVGQQRAARRAALATQSQPAAEAPADDILERYDEVIRLVDQILAMGRNAGTR